MKKKFRRNQMIITVLAIMIAAAGYLNYADKLKTEDEENLADAAADSLYQDDSLLASGDDIESLDVDYDLVLSESDLLTEETESETTADKDAPVDGNSSDGADPDRDGAEDGDSSDGTEQGTQTADADNGTEAAADGSQPGDTLFVSSTGVLTFVAEAKLSREQARAKSKETLLEIVNNESLSESAKQDAVDGMVELADAALKEAAAETLLTAKGFSNCVVMIQEDSVDVIVNAGMLSDSERAQIEEIVTSKTGIGVDHITIVPLSESDE